jgi:hypothetical protein
MADQRPFSSRGTGHARSRDRGTALLCRFCLTQCTEPGNTDFRILLIDGRLAARAMALSYPASGLTVGHDYYNRSKSSRSAKGEGFQQAILTVIKWYNPACPFPARPLHSLKRLSRSFNVMESEQGVFQAVEELAAADEEGHVSFMTLSSIMPSETLNVER